MRRWRQCGDGANSASARRGTRGLERPMSRPSAPRDARMSPSLATKKMTVRECPAGACLGQSGPLPPNKAAALVGAGVLPWRRMSVHLRIAWVM